MYFKKTVSPAYRYVIAGCCALLMFINVGLLTNIFSSFFPFIMKEHHFTNTQLSLLTTTRNISALICMIAADKFYEKLSLRTGIFITLVCAVLSHLIYSFTSTPMMYYIASVIIGISYGLGGVIPAAILIQRWFTTHVATALAFTSAGTGVAAVLGPVILTRLCQHFGLAKTFFMEAMLMVFGTILLMLLIRESPSASEQDSAKTSEPQNLLSDIGPDIPFTGNLRIYTALFLVGVIGLTSYSNFSMLYTTCGHPIEIVSLAISFLGGMLLLGKCTFGLSCDRFGTGNALTAFCLFLLIGQSLCCLAPWIPSSFIFVTLFIFGLGTAVPGVSIQILASGLSSPKTYARTVKNYQLTHTLGGLLSSAIPGIIADASGSYVPAHILFTFCAAAILFLLVPAYKKYAM